MEFDNRGSVSDAIIAAVAEERDVDALDLKPLYPAADMDALERLVEQPNNVSKVVFTYEGCEVIVEGTGVVRVLSDA